MTKLKKKRKPKKASKPKPPKPKPHQFGVLRLPEDAEVKDSGLVDGGNSYG